MRSEVATRAEFSQIRYAQVWEDADILLAGLDIQPGHVCVSIASAGDNALAMLTRDPGRVIALDLNPAQLACLELRVAAFRELTHAELLELIGSRPSTRRDTLYARCRSALSPDVRTFWDARSAEIAAGIGSAGKMERYFALLPHEAAAADPLARPRAEDARTEGCRGARALLRIHLEHVALASAVPHLLLARRDGPDGPRSVVLHVCRRQRRGSHHGARAARDGAAGSERQPVSALADHRHARR